MRNPEKPSYLALLSYRIFGKLTPYFAFNAFREVYQKSGISRLYESYIALMLFTGSVTFGITLVIGFVFHHLLLNLTLTQYLVAVLTLSSTITIITLSMYIIYPLYRKNQRRKEIDANLVYTTGYMGVLSAGGISLERIFERVTQVEKRTAIRELAMRLIADVKVFGLDVTGSLDDLAQISPSETFSKLLVGLNNTVQTSGDLKSLLTYETKRLLQNKREQLKKTLGTLMALGEIYITAIVMGPILFLVMLTILSIMGNTPFGLSPVEQLNLLVFIGLPMISSLYILILNGVLPEED